MTNGEVRKEKVINAGIMQVCIKRKTGNAGYAVQLKTYYMIGEYVKRVIKNTIVKETSLPEKQEKQKEYLEVCVKIPIKDDYCNDCKFVSVNSICNYFNETLYMNMYLIKPLRCTQCKDMEV